MKFKKINKNKDKIILLDLNYTLVGNQMQTRMLRPFSRRLRHESYRQWLIDLVKDNYVIIITARPDYQRQETMANIWNKNEWLPDENWFNTHNLSPPECKRKILKDHIFPQHGTDGNKYFAIESNPQTKAMYAEYGIQSLSVGQSDLKEENYVMADDQLSLSSFCKM